MDASVVFARRRTALLIAAGSALLLAMLPAIGSAVWIFTRQDASKTLGLLVPVLPYITVAAFGWMIGARNLLLSTAAGLAACVALAVGLPKLSNQAVNAEVQRVTRQDAEPAPFTGTPQVVALLRPAETGSGTRNRESDCELLCQRLLYWGGAKAVLAGATPLDGRPEHATDLVRYWVERRAKCPYVRVAMADVLEGTHMVLGTHPTSETTERAITGGACLLSFPADLSEAQVVALRTRFDMARLLASQHSWGGVVDAADRIYVRDESAWRLTGHRPMSDTRRSSRLSDSADTKPTCPRGKRSGRPPDFII